MRSLIGYGLLVACTFLFKAASPGESFAEAQTKSLDSSFNPVEIAQLSPGHVQILENEPDDAGKSRLQFTENTLKQAGFILPETNPTGVIIKNFGNHQNFGLGEIVYLDAGSTHGVTKGGKFTIFSRVRPILHPVYKGNIRENIPDYKRPLAEPYPTYFSRVGKRMGHLVQPLGILEILEATAESSKAIIRESYNPITLGDFIIPFEKLSAPPRLPETKGEEKLEGYIIAFKREHYVGGLNEILYIDRGSNDRVIPGDRFEVYVTPTTGGKLDEFTPREVSLIPQVVAEVQVLDTQKETSTAIVISGIDPIPLGAAIRYKPVDIVRPPLTDVLALQEAPLYAPAVIEIPLEQTEEPPPAEEPFADLGPVLLEDEEIEFTEQELPAFAPTEALKDIHFKFDQYDLDEASRNTLLANVEYLQQHPNVQIRIEGYCDERGTNNYNLALGERRASSVKSFLSSQGIDEQRLHLISYGEEKPFCLDSEESCWSQNRRVHFLASGSNLPVN